MNRRQREKKAVKVALESSIYMPVDRHFGKEPRIEKKIRLAIGRQVARGERKVELVGDVWAEKKITKT